MKILKEAYTRDEIKQRVVDTRNIISALQDSLSILQSSLLDADPSADEEECSKLARYTRTYEIDIEDMMKDFSDDFESFLVEKEEEEDFEDDYEYEDEEVVEESLKESWGLPNYQYARRRRPEKTGRAAACSAYRGRWSAPSSAFSHPPRWPGWPPWPLCPSRES